ncbi:hypothetical protein P8452_14928 [Trifolium repens]|nr:hypothetical protein P8452_14928 [Trifolium repens]
MFMDISRFLSSARSIQLREVEGRTTRIFDSRVSRRISLQKVIQVIEWAGYKLDAAIEQFTDVAGKWVLILGCKL